MEDGSLDKFCVRCRKFAMQAQMSLPTSLTVDNDAILEKAMSEPTTIESIARKIQINIERGIRSKGVM